MIKPNRPRLLRLLLLAAAFALVAAACGDSGDDESSTDTTQATNDGDSDLSGEIVVSGSSTVEPITARIAEDFSDANSGVSISVDGPGTGDGFELFCNGETDISDASRAIKDEEATTCADNGIEYVELQVAIDGLSVLTSPANDAVTCLTFEDVYALVGPESTGFGNWSDANDLGAELGGAGDYPDAPLDVTGPGEESGTYDTFVEFVIEDLADERGQDHATRPDYTSSPNDNVIVDGISGSDTSFGWVGFAFYVENQDALKAIELDGGDGCVAPTPETIADGSYPMSRPLFIYINNTKAAEKPELEAFVDYYLSDEGLTNVAAAGYVDLTADSIAETRAAWDGR